MPDKIEPVLTARGWKAVRSGGPLPIAPCSHVPESHRCPACEAHVHIALANAVLPDDDLRKITREKLSDLESCAGWTEGEGQSELAERARMVIAALESYLPPTP